MTQFKTLALATALGATCAFAASAQVQSAQEAVRETGSDWEEAYNAGELDRLMETYAEDAVSMAPGFPASVGWDAIRADLEAFLSEYDAQHETEIQEIIVEGDLAIERADYSDALTPTSGGPTVTEEGKHIVVYQRNEEGEWKILWEIWNQNSSSAP